MNKYLEMQKKWYEADAANWSVENLDAVVGSFNAHNNWPDYEEYLFKDIDTSQCVALDFACGPGRNIVKFNKLFQRIDGVDIAPQNLIHAKAWALRNGITEDFNTYCTDGSILSEIGDNQYNVVFSTIALQHICVYRIRFSLMTEFFRVLKPGGWFTAQMGYGPHVDMRQKAGYYDDLMDADSTNGGCDTRVESPDQLKGDFDSIGFINFTHWIRPTGPGDKHPNWIFFRGQKP